MCVSGDVVGFFVFNFILLFNLISLLPFFVWVFCLPVCLHHIHAWCQLRLKESIRSLGNGVRDRCELPSEYWELNSSPPEKQPVQLIFLTTTHLSSLFAFETVMDEPCLPMFLKLP